MKNTNQTQPFDDIQKEIQELKDELERIHYAGTIGLRQEYEKAKPALDSLKFLLQMNKSSSKDEQQDFQHQINSLTKEFFKHRRVTVIPFIKKEALDESTFREVHTLVESVYLMLIQAGIEVNIENTILNKE
ncbi:hypothetical protein [Pelistega europaea]|uniref:Uncharacterized protein n=1 Tax=Pelistega europaea TaxID=106147 RepID=A0A7Y4P5V9_9BURK|nr:hypothetical protein [Pelistega europaea]NOL49274.1 hypothetical protein [Pelistega europaea]